MIDNETTVRALLDTAADLLSGDVLVVAADGTIQRVLSQGKDGPFDSGESLSGLDLEDVLSLSSSVPDSLSGTDDKQLPDVFNAIHSTGEEPLPCVLMPPYGDAQEVACRSRSVDDTGCVLLAVTASNSSESLNPSSTLLRSILSIVPVGVVCVEATGSISVVNERAEEILDTTAEELIGSSYVQDGWELTDSDGNQIPLSDNPIKQTLETGKPLSELGYWLEGPNGDRRWLSVQTQPIFDGENIQRVVIGLNDTTGLKRRDRHLRQLVENRDFGGIGGWELDVETDRVTGIGTLGLYRNEPSSEYKPTLSEALEYYHPNDRDDVLEAVLSCQETGETMEVEARRETAAGQTRWVRLRAESVGDNSTDRIRGTIRDITVVKEREQRLRVMNRVLRHNIRNRVTTIQGNAGLLESQLSELPVVESLPEISVQRDSDTQIADPEELEVLIESLEPVEDIDIESLHSRALTIKNSARELHSVAEKVRQYHKIVQRDIDDSVTNIGSVIENISEKFDDTHPNATIQVKNVTNQPVVGDPTAVQHVLNEVIENALKHNDQSNPIVRIRTKLDQSGLAIRVLDNGPGMPDAEQEIVNHGRETPISHSSGVGLWSAKWIVRRLGGNISTALRNPHGTIVEVVLPQPGSTEEV